MCPVVRAAAGEWVLVVVAGVAVFVLIAVGDAVLMTGLIIGEPAFGAEAVVGLGDAVRETEAGDAVRATGAGWWTGEE